METTTNKSPVATDYSANGYRMHSIKGRDDVRIHRVRFTSPTTAVTIATGSTWTLQAIPSLVNESTLWLRDRDGLRGIAAPGIASLLLGV